MSTRSPRANKNGGIHLNAASQCCVFFYFFFLIKSINGSLKEEVSHDYVPIIVRIKDRKDERSCDVLPRRSWIERPLEAGNGIQRRIVFTGPRREEITR